MGLKANRPSTPLAFDWLQGVAEIELSRWCDRIVKAGEA